MRCGLSFGLSSASTMVSTLLRLGMSDATMCVGCARLIAAIAITIASDFALPSRNLRHFLS